MLCLFKGKEKKLGVWLLKPLSPQLIRNELMLSGCNQCTHVNGYEDDLESQGDYPAQTFVRFSQ